MKRNFGEMNNGNNFTTNSNGGSSPNYREMNIEELQKLVDNFHQVGGGNQQTKQNMHLTNEKNLAKAKLSYKNVYDDDGKAYQVIDFQNSPIEAIQHYVQKLEEKESARAQKKQKNNSNNNNNNILSNNFYEDISDENIIKLAYDPNYKVLNNSSHQDNLVTQYRIFNSKFFNQLSSFHKESLRETYQSFKDNNWDIKKLPIIYQQALKELQNTIMPDKYKLFNADPFSILFHDHSAIIQIESYLNYQPEQELIILGLGQVIEG